MKKVFLFLMLCGFMTTGIAQNKNVIKRAKATTAYVAEQMSLNDEQSKFLEEVLTEKMADTSSKINGKNLSKEEKKAIYGESHKKTAKKLSEKFSKDEAQAIFGHIKEFNKLNKKK